MRHVLYAVVALALVLLAVVCVTAAPMSETPVVRIRAGDLDLGSESGIAALGARIDAVADRVCMPVAQGRIPPLSSEQACREDIRLDVAEHLGALQPYGPVLAAALTQSPP